MLHLLHFEKVYGSIILATFFTHEIIASRLYLILKYSRLATLAGKGEQKGFSNKILYFQKRQFQNVYK